MKLTLSVFFLCIFLHVSCTKEEVDGFDRKIIHAADFKIDPATGDTIYRIYMANGFTPNGDGINDQYLVFGEGWDYGTYSLRVYSRGNNAVYYSTDPFKGWSGAMIGQGQTSVSQLLMIEVNVDDILHEHHHYLYEVVLFR